MLKSLLLALILGGHDLLAVRVAELERLPVGARPDVVKSQLRAVRLLMELDEVGRLLQKLGAKLASESSEDFEEGLSRVIDEPMFAELLGRLFHWSMQVMGDPERVRFIQQFDEKIGSVRGDSSDIAERFLRETDVLNDVDWAGVSLDQLAWASDDLRSIHEEDPIELGRIMLEMLYDPAATERMSSFTWVLIRTIGRMAVMRHLQTHEFVPSARYADSMFADCRSDVDEIAALFALAFQPSPAAAVPLVLESFKLRVSRNRLDDVMERLDEHPNAWTETFGSPRRAHRASLSSGAPLE